MMERRQAYRVSTFARIAARPIDDAEESSARLRVAARSAADVGRTIDDSVTSPEERIRIELMARMVSALGRMEQRIDRLIELYQTGGNEAMPFSAPVPVSLSAVGLSAPLGLTEPEGSLVEMLIDLLDPGVPIIPALGSVVRSKAVDGPASSDPKLVALHFCEISETDRERLFHYSLRLQRQSLRGRERKEST